MGAFLVSHRTTEVEVNVPVRYQGPVGVMPDMLVLLP